MRILIVATALALGGCNVSTDSANNSMTVQYDQNKAENTAAGWAPALLHGQAIAPTGHVTLQSKRRASARARPANPCRRDTAAANGPRNRHIVNAGR